METPVPITAKEFVGLAELDAMHKGLSSSDQAWIRETLFEVKGTVKLRRGGMALPRLICTHLVCAYGTKVAPGSHILGTLSGLKPEPLHDVHIGEMYQLDRPKTHPKFFVGLAALASLSLSSHLVGTPVSTWTTVLSANGFVNLTQADLEGTERYPHLLVPHIPKDKPGYPSYRAYVEARQAAQQLLTEPKSPVADMETDLTLA